MPQPDDTTEPAAPTQRRGPPSLLGGNGAASQPGPNGDPAQVRMLAEFGATSRPGSGVGAGAGGASSVPRVVGALAAVIVLVAGWWWWNASRAPGVDATRVVAAVQADPARAESAPALEPASKADASASQSASSSASAPAVIETMPQAALPLSVPGAVSGAQAAASAVIAPVPSSAAAAASVPRSAPLAKAKPSEKRPAKQVAAAPAAQRSAARPPRATSNVTDADVLLLSAMLAHVSRSGQAGVLADGDQMTIAQLVRRCDGRAGDESRECRRRICDGYWGKADACPAALAAKKN